MRTLTFLDFPGVELLAINFDEFPRPPKPEVVKVVGWLNRRTHESGGCAERVNKRARREFFAASRVLQEGRLPPECNPTIALNLDPIGFFGVGGG
jgi:hypothetical protein